MFSSTTGFRTCTIVALGAMILATLLLGGCGRSSVPAPQPPTVTGATPAAGLSAGGDPITVSGTNFLPGATVLVGGNPATNVAVLDGGTLTCDTPPGIPGALAAVQVQTTGGLGVLLGAYLYIPPPKINQVTPLSSSTFGGMQHTVVGSGFMDNAAGPNTVTVGGVLATGVVTVSDTVILFTAPAGAPGLADVEVTNANGIDDDPLNYFIPIMAAQGGANHPPWDLFAINPSTGTAYLIGPLPIGITGMDFSPTGTLYGVTAAGNNPRDIVTIDPATAAVALVGPLTAPDGLTYKVNDICFVGTTLYATSFFETTGAFLGTLLTIDSVTGAATSIVNSFFPFEFGGGFAADAGSANVYWMSHQSSPLLTVDVLTPSLGVGPTLSGGLEFSVDAAAFNLGALYGIGADGGGSSPTQLYRIDTATAVMTPVGPALPPRVSALASPVR